MWAGHTKQPLGLGALSFGRVVTLKARLKSHPSDQQFWVLANFLSCGHAFPLLLKTPGVATEHSVLGLVISFG